MSKKLTNEDILVKRERSETIERYNLLFICNTIINEENYYKSSRVGLK